MSYLASVTCTVKLISKYINHTFIDRTYLQHTQISSRERHYRTQTKYYKNDGWGYPSPLVHGRLKVFLGLNGLHCYLTSGTMLRKMIKYPLQQKYNYRINLICNSICVVTPYIVSLNRDVYICLNAVLQLSESPTFQQRYKSNVDKQVLFYYINAWNVLAEWAQSEGEGK